MKRLALAALFLCACPPGSLEGGRYACDPKGDRSVGSTQCPGEWRCGLEGFCHEHNNARVPWLCETDTDCENGFQCGIAATRDHRECHDPAAPKSYPCEAASDCAGGWACGLAANRTDRECHDPAAPKSYPCETASDCVAGWSCGLAMSRDVRECHDPAMPKPYACAVDDDCVSGWRCSSEQLCANPAKDALYGGPAVGASGAARINPVDAQPFDLVSVSPTQGDLANHNITVVASQRGDTLAALLIDSSGPSFRSYETTESAPKTLVSVGERSTSVDDQGDNYLDYRPRFYATVDAGMVSWQVQADGGLTREPFTSYDGTSDVPPVSRPTRYKHTTGPYLVQNILAFTSNPADGYMHINGPNDWVEGIDYRVQSHDLPHFREVAGNTVHDMAEFDTDGGWACTFASDDRGLWVYQEDFSAFGFGYVPVLTPQLGNTGCPGTAATTTVNRLQTYDPGWLGVESIPDGGDAQLTLFDFGDALLGNPGEDHCSAFMACDNVPLRIDLGPCTACPGQKLLDFSIVGPTAAPELEVRCGDAAGHSSTYFHLGHVASGSAACDRRLVLGQSSLFTVRDVKSTVAPVGGTVAWSGAAGEVWLGASTSTATSLTLDRAPDGMVLKGIGPRDFLAFTPDVVGFPVDGFGVASTQSVGLVAPVANATHWALRGSTLVDLTGAATGVEGKTIAVVTQSLGAPWAAALATTSANTRLGIVTSGGKVFSAELESVLAGTDPFSIVSLRLELVNQIQSLAVPSQAMTSSTNYLEGYVLTAAGVKRLVAETATRWRVEDLPLPSSVTPIEVWFEKDRGRVGCSDGSVYSLPSRVPLADPSPTGAVDYAQTCGQQLLLAVDGLYRLDARPGALKGTWVKLALPAGFGAGGLDGARVHALGADIYVFTRSGETARLTLDSCP